jgi:hypothetical protein
MGEDLQCVPPIASNIDDKPLRDEKVTKQSANVRVIVYYQNGLAQRGSIAG